MSIYILISLKTYKAMMFSGVMKREQWPEMDQIILPF